jgi:hypothetical protein
MQNVPSWLKLLVAYLIAPNLIMLLLFRMIHGERSLLNLDYLLFALLVPWLKAPLRYAGMLLLLLFDLFHALASTYYFGLPAALRASADVIHLSRFGILSIALAVVVAGLVIDRLTLAIAGQPQRNLRDMVVVITVAGLLTGVDLLNGSAIVLGPRQSTLTPINVSGSGTFALTYALYLVVRDSDVRKIPAESVTRKIVAEDAGRGALLASDESLVVVIVESWGKFIDVKAHERMLQLFYAPDIVGRYRVDTGSVRFRGHTTDAEFRELCGWSSGSITLLESSASECLPHQLSQSGFTTAAFHGFTQRMFSRNRWYPMVGFDRSSFAEQLNQRHERTCGSLFEGICDDDVASEVESLLIAPSPGKRKFVYWLTLNSHLPLRPEDVGPQVVPCDQGLAEERDVCSITQIIYRILGRVARIAANPSLPQTRFVIVGDHSPTLPQRSSRGLFDQREVPYVALYPADENHLQQIPR